VRGLVAIAFGVAWLLPAAPVRADCVDGVRKTTPREAEYFARVYAALKDALPAPPQDWSAAPVSERGLPSLCSSTREGDFSIDVRAKYTYRMPKEQADRNQADARKLQAEIDALEKMPPEVAKERQGWMDRYSEATRAARQAAKDGDKALEKQKYAERDDYGRKADAVRASHQESIKAKVEPLRARLAELSTAPVDVALRIAANDPYPDRLDPKRASELVVGTSPAPKTPGMKVHGIRVVAEGPSPRREALMSAVDRAKLEGLLR
jgi:hypothetical protein